MHRGRRRRQAENAIYRKSSFAIRPSRRRTRVAICNRDGLALRTALPRQVCARSCEPLPFLDPVRTLRIDDRDEPDDAAIAAIPIPGEEGEGAAAAGDLVDIAADILDA